MKNDKYILEGISVDGKTLKEQRAEVLNKTKETGYYNGIKELELKNAEPIRFEKIFSRLRAGVVNARETSKKIAASPIVEQEGELCFSLYNAVGDALLTSTGIIIHVGTMGAAIKYMIENGWEQNPKINDGDIFTNNDVLLGNVHPCDIHTIVPIFWDEKLIGWVGGVTHVIDTGAVGPGSMTVGPVQRFGDGIQMTCRKTGANDESFKDWLHESQRNVRTTRFWLLDERTRIAGCHMIRELVLELIKEEGIKKYLQFAFEVIEDGRRGLQNRLKAMTIPGKYKQVAFVDVPYRHDDVNVPPFAKVDTIMHGPSEINIRADGSWKLDFEGASRWGWHSYNAQPVSFTSGIWVMMTQTLIPTERINDGAFYATQFKLPKGSWMNPDDRRTAHSYSWHFLVSTWSGLWRGLSRAYFGRGYLEEVNAGNANTSNWLQGGGFNQFNEIHAVNSFESAAEGTGASAVKDGIGNAAAIWNPEGDMGDMEIWELAEPLLYLGRNVKPNTGGLGKYRGGNGYETLRMVWGAKDWTMFFMGNGYISSCWGLMGGYPAAAGYRFEAHGTDIKERIEKQEVFPTGADIDPGNPEYEKNLKAKVIKRDQQAITTESIFEDYDLYLNYLRGGPGFGDPLDREYFRIETDLNEGQVIPEYAASVYGVVFNKDENNMYSIDAKASDKKREEILQERLAKAVPVKTWMKGEREKILNKDAALQVQAMFASSFNLSKIFLNEFREFWDLPGDWDIKEEDLDQPSFASKYRQGIEQLPDVIPVILTEE